ncbi:MAG TPA: chloride channel protein [Acidimicrobiales bacterium]|nr:chloride channel protein [Acidimicrobiales bacterium]
MRDSDPTLPGRFPPAPELSVQRRNSARRQASRLGTRVNNLPYLSRWLVLATLIGIIAGLGAVVFYEALSIATHGFLVDMAGYHVPTPAGEGGAAGSAGYSRPWAIPLVVVLGALVSGWLVFTWAPEAEGHGTDSAIEAVHHNPRGIRLRAVVVKIVASAFTIGSGGSGGREGPTAQISAGFGSLLARMLDLSPEDGRIAVSVGIGSGIGAIFGAPLGGAVLASDVVYRDDFETSALIPGVFASVVAYAIFGLFFGYHHLFAVPGGYHFHAAALAWFALLGVVAGGVGLLYAKVFYFVGDLSGRLPMSRKLRPAVGALLVGLIAVALPETLGTGYGWIQKGLVGQMGHVSLWIIIALPFVRILATSLSIGTGGSGGVFGPGLVIGAFTGLALWRVLGPGMPGLGHSPAAFVVVGMMSVFGGISRAPLAVILMVAEMTGGVGLLAPAMVAVAISTFIVAKTDDSIYRSQLRTRADLPGARLQSAMPLLTRLTVAGAARSPKVMLIQSMPAAEALEELATAGVPGAPVVDDNGLYVGAVDKRALEELAATEPRASSQKVVDATAATISADANMSSALEALSQAGGHWVTVTGGSRQVVGILASSDVVRAYRRALYDSLGQLARAAPNTVGVELRISDASPVRDVAIRDARLPAGCIIVSVQRGSSLLFAEGATVLRDGDILSVLVPSGHEDEVRERVTGGAVAPHTGHML